MTPIHNRPVMPEHRSAAVLRANGALLRVVVSPPTRSQGPPDVMAAGVGRSREGFAMIDTGASHTCAERKVLEGLGFAALGFAIASTPAGTLRPQIYAARLSLPDEALEFELDAVFAIDFGAGPPPDAPERSLPIVLLGRDLLSGFQLVYNGPGGFFTLST